MTLEELVIEINAWQDRTFPHSTAKSKAAHLLREAQELHDNPEDPEEIADVFILLAGIAYKNNYNLLEICRKKMEINQQRKWGKPDSEGVVEHIR